MLGSGKMGLMSNSTFFDFKSRMSKPKNTNQFLWYTSIICFGDCWYDIKYKLNVLKIHRQTQKGLRLVSHPWKKIYDWPKDHFENGSKCIKRFTLRPREICYYSHWKSIVFNNSDWACKEWLWKIKWQSRLIAIKKWGCKCSNSPHDQLAWGTHYQIWQFANKFGDSK